jgi:hypothetical protein
MLRYNYNTASGLCARQWGTTLGLQRYFYSRAELRNYTASEGFENNIAGIPNGHSEPSVWILPQSSGSIAAYENLRSTVTLSLVPPLPPVLAGIVGSVSLAVSGAATILGRAPLSGAVTPFAELSPKNLADAVWNAEKSEYTTANTMGKTVINAESSAALASSLAAAI